MVIKQGDGVVRFFLDGRGGFKIAPVRIEKRHDGARPGLFMGQGEKLFEKLDVLLPGQR